MDIPEATDALRPGEKYVFLSPEQVTGALSESQLGAPTVDGVVVHYRGSEIISVEGGGNDTYQWMAPGVGTVDTLREAINRLQLRMNPEGSMEETQKKV